MSLGLQSQGGGILVRAHSAHPINLLYVLWVTGITNLSISPAVTEKESPSGRKQEERKIVGENGRKRERENESVCFYPFVSLQNASLCTKENISRFCLLMSAELNRSGK